MLSKFGWKESWATGLVALIVAGLGVAYLWQRQDPPQNVILITLDTTRADHLGSYGYQRGETTVFDDFGKNGVVFERAFASAPITLPSHTSILTGLYPPEHGLRLNGLGYLPTEVPILSEILKKNGFQTAAFLSAAVLDSTFGLNRGFDLYDDYLSASQRARTESSRRRRHGHQVVDSALGWLKEHDSKRFFCWIHLFDAHSPYSARETDFGDRFKDNPYDAGIAADLKQVDRVLKYLKERRLNQNTLVVITADHGEGLGEHREPEHGMLAYNSTLHVPLVFGGTRHCTPGRRVSTVVSLTDIFPTILELLNLKVPEHSSGRSLKAALKGDEIPSKPCYAEAETPYALNHLCPLFVAISDRWKYVHTTKPELFDLQTDPSEQANLAATEPDKQKEMENVLEQMRLSFRTVQVQKLQLSDKQMNDLTALGYTGVPQIARDPQGEEFTHLKDVKDFLPAMEKYEEAKRMMLKGDNEAALALSREVERMVGPGEFLEAGFMLADCLIFSGQQDEAIETFLTILEKHPDFHHTRLRLAAALRQSKQYEQAAEEYRKFIAAEPELAAGHFELARTLVKLKNPKDAIAEFREAIRLAPNISQSHYELGHLYLQLNLPRDAAACFEEALRFEPKHVMAQFQLLRTLVSLGEFSKAHSYARKAVENDPSSFEARYNLGVFLASQNRLREAIAELKEAQKLRPDEPNVAKQIELAEAAFNRLGK